MTNPFYVGDIVTVDEALLDNIGDEITDGKEYTVVTVGVVKAFGNRMIQLAVGIIDDKGDVVTIHYDNLTLVRTMYMGKSKHLVRP